MRIFLPFFILAFLAIDASGQIKLPDQINSGSDNMAIAMLPDSSFVVGTTDQSKFIVYRYAYKNGLWISEPNQLTELLNSIIYADSHLHFRFSNDFTRMVVMLHGKGDQRIYLTELQNGSWSFFRDIIDPISYSYFNFAPSFSLNNEKLYLSDNSKPANTIYCYNNTQLFIDRTTNVFSDFDEVYDVVGIGNDSFIIQAFSKKRKDRRWYFIKRMENGAWSVPYHIKELDGDQTKFSLSLTPFDNLMVYVSFFEGKAYLIETPEIIQNELAVARRESNVLPTQSTMQARSETDKDKGGNTVKPNGKFYALLIGNSNYLNNELDLSQPHKDVIKLEEVLTSHYLFEKKDVIRLENADRETIFRQLYQLRSVITKSDNLLIFYAGHGYWDEKVEQGYWWPTDARPDNPSNWLSNSDLREQLRGLNTAHTLLISDACFSGGIFKARGGGDEIRNASAEIQLLYRMPSRRAMTSGTMSTVPDNSVFFKYLVKYLTENDTKFLPSSELFTQVRKSVLNNSLTVPQDGVIMGTGDEGGDFIFIKKD
jgi:hypothetical protein